MRQNKEQLIEKILMQSLDEHSAYTQDFIEGLRFGIKSALQSEQARAESSKPDHIPDTSKMVDNFITLRKRSPEERELYFVSKVVEKDRQIRILREGINEAAAARGAINDAKVFNDSFVIIKPLVQALAAADKLNKQE